MLGEGVSLCGVGGGLRRGRVVGSARNASRSRRACIGAAWGSGSAREGRVAVRGRATVLRRGMCCEAGRCASGLRGRAEVLGQGASLCGDGSRSSAGNGW